MMDLARIKGNVAKMASMNAPEEDIDGYIASEGASIDDVRNFNPAAAPKAAASEMPTTSGRTALDQSLQGATFGFADEVANRVGAYGASLITGEKYDDLLKEATQQSKERLQAEMKQRPVESIVSNLAGGLLTGGAGVSTKAGAAVANSLRTGNIAARIAKGAVAGATSGGLYGAGSADEGQRLAGAEHGAYVGGAFGAATPAASAAASSVIEGTGNAIKGAFARTPEAVQDASAALKSGAGSLYNQMRDVGAVLNPSSSNGLLATIDAEVAKNKFIPALNPKTTGIIEHLADTIRNNNGQIGLDELDQYRRLLGRVGGSEDGVSAGAAKKAIDNIVLSLDDKGLVNGGQEAISLLKKGRAAYAQASKFDDISDIITKADGDPNKIKSGLTRFVNNKDNTIGWSKNELSVLKDAARSGIGEKLLKMGGKFGFDLGTSLTPGNTVAPIIGAFGAGAAGGAVTGGLVPVAGTASRQLQKYIARGKAEQLLQALQSNNAPPNYISKSLNAMPGNINIPALSNQASKAALMAQMLQKENTSH